MYENRISRWLQPAAAGTWEVLEQGAEQSSHIFPLVSVQQIYQVAAENAYREHQLDRLFNAEYYGDHGSGI